MRLRYSTALGNTLNQTTGTTVTDGVAVDAALRTERAAIEWGLQTLDAAVLSGAELDVACDVVAAVEDSCAARLAYEEQTLRNGQPGGLEGHIAARREFLRSLHAARIAVRAGAVEVMLDIADLLSAFQLANYSRQDAGRRAGTIQ
jgi:hypothetical protein